MKNRLIFLPNIVSPHQIQARTEKKHFSYLSIRGFHFRRLPPALDSKCLERPKEKRKICHFQRRFTAMTVYQCSTVYGPFMGNFLVDVCCTNRQLSVFLTFSFLRNTSARNCCECVYKRKPCNIDEKDRPKGGH